jgi:hypothetical protein
MSLCLVIRPAILGAIGLLDRLSRNLAFIATLMDSGTKFVAVDNPHANRLTLHIFAAVAHHGREMIAARTKAALQASKARGTRLGSNGAEKLAPAYRAEAPQWAADRGTDRWPGALCDEHAGRDRPSDGRLPQGTHGPPCGACLNAWAFTGGTIRSN